MTNQPASFTPEHVVAYGAWGLDTTWEFVLSQELPSPKLCTAVACVAITNIDTQEIALTRNMHSQDPARRGMWELPAGHIDPLDPNEPHGKRETLRQALDREAREESGFIVKKAALFGYRRIENAQPSPYPALSYLPYYWATTKQALIKPTDPGQPKERSFPIETIRNFAETGIMQQEEIRLIEYGLAAALLKLRGVGNGVHDAFS
jgi:ADP-ribose pyrophosphatase YjhB (NUDIX family)